MKKTYKFNTLDPMPLGKYGFGLFLFDNKLCLKSESGIPFVCSTGEVLYENKIDERNELIITPIEF